MRIDRVELGIFAVLGAFLVVCVLILSRIISNDIQRESDFMEECVEYRPQYECTAMWRSGQPSVVPVFIPN